MKTPGGQWLYSVSLLTTSFSAKRFASASMFSGIRLTPGGRNGKLHRNPERNAK